MDQELSRQAIQAALNRDWKLSIRLNLQILDRHPKDTEALNRLARAYLEAGHKIKAQDVYRQVLKLDRFNSIATRGLDQAKSRQKLTSPSAAATPPPLFLEEPGITKTVTLSRLGDPQTLAALRPADPVSITAREHCVSVLSPSRHYLGRLPDDLASRLRSLLKAGNTYQAWIRSLELHNSDRSQPSLKIFIREISRAPKYKDTPSFPLTEKLTYAAFTPPELVHEEKPDITTTGEDAPEPDLETGVD